MKNEVSLTDKFYGLAGVYHQYIFKYERNKKIPVLRVIQQNKNRKLKNQNCNQRTSLSLNTTAKERVIGEKESIMIVQCKLKMPTLGITV